jgi:uncharacterized protein YdiU (UPF0061 family)
MEPSEFLDILTRLLQLIKSGATKHVSAQTDRNNIRSVVSAWFTQYRPSFLSMVGDESLLTLIDSQMQTLLKLAADNNPRRTVVKTLKAAKDHFSDTLLVPLSRAYWSRVPQHSSASRDEEVVKRLSHLSAELTASYEQSILDLQDVNRLSYRGPASELREVVTGALHLLAPDERVKATEWYKESRRSGVRKESNPTRAERTKYILRSRGGISAITEAAESFMTSVEERLGDVVVATYKRGSAATHGASERDEVLQLLQYINALLRELLPPASHSANQNS